MPRLTVIVLAGALLLGCSSAPGPTTEPAPTAEIEFIEQTASDLVRQAALAADPQEANRLHLMAAAAWLQETEVERARYQFGLVDSTQLAQQDQVRWYSLSVRLLIAEDSLAEALALVENIPELATPESDLDWQWHMLRAQTYTLNARYQEAALGFYGCSRTDWINRDSCREGLWNALSRLETGGLDQLRQYSSDPGLQGWIDLAQVALLNLGDFTTQSQALTRWQRSHANHDAAQALPPPLGNLQQMAAAAPAHIAVLLPLSGSLGPAGSAVLDGILSAFYASATRASQPPRISVYDTESLPMDLLIEILRSENFDGIIGPLERERVDQLVRAPSLETPVVALNQLTNSSISAIGIGLAIESEARQIAEEAAREGHHAAIIMAPNSSWGERTAETFASSWQAMDRSVAAILRFSGSTDQAPLLESALHIDQSNSRRSALQGLLGKQLVFTPRRRGDVDMMLMAASPDQARQITPLMAFFFAEDLPIYAPSTIYAGGQNTDLNRDLDEVAFLNYPWIFQQSDPRIASLPDPVANVSQDMKNLQALGVDAYYLMRRFHQLQSYPQVIYHGQTGTLQLGGDGNMQRHLPWATFRGGRIVTLDGPR